MTQFTSRLPNVTEDYVLAKRALDKITLLAGEDAVNELAKHTQFLKTAVMALSDFVLPREKNRFNSFILGNPEKHESPRLEIAILIPLANLTVRARTKNLPAKAINVINQINSL